MINLLPPEIKTEMIFARRNAVIRRYIILLAAVGMVAAGAIGSTTWYISTQLTAAQSDLTSKQALISKNQSIEAPAKALSDRLKILKTIAAGQAHFSAALADFARVLPQGVSLIGLQLTGDDKKPLQISALAPNYPTAVSTRDAIATSPRVAAVDIQTISANAGTYRIDLVISFKPGAAK